jgi:hypothetical protein
MAVPPPPDEASWKLAEYERHFNTIQAGIRGLASVWLLAAFSAIATLMKRDEVNKLWLPPEWIIASICAMGAVGLALLWIIDQLVYHRLLNAVFIVGLKLEYDEPRRPPLHASMYASVPKIGYAKLLSLFYLLPIGALGAVAIAATVYGIHRKSHGWEWALIVVAAVPTVLAILIYSRGGRERVFFRDQAAHFNEDAFTNLFADVPGQSKFHNVLERYSPPDRDHNPTAGV